MARTREQQEQAIARGQDARNALMDGVILEAFRFVETTALDRCRSAQTPDDAYHASLSLQVAADFRRQLEAFVADGKRAATELEKKIHSERERRAAERAHEDYLTAATAARAAHDAHRATATREEQPNG